MDVNCFPCVCVRVCVCVCVRVCVCMHVCACVHITAPVHVAVAITYMDKLTYADKLTYVDKHWETQVDTYIVTAMSHLSAFTRYSCIIATYATRQRLAWRNLKQAAQQVYS